MTGGGAAGEILDAQAFAARFPVSRETLDRLQVYADELVRWQPAVNLVAPATLAHVWHRHLADSAQLYDLLPAGPASLVDLGSGAGFPGLVLAIMGCERGLTVKLVESDRRKAAFLGHVARCTGIAVDIVVSRIESTETQLKVGTSDVVTARALAPLVRLLVWSHNLFGAHTTGLFLKGRDAVREVEDARQAWDFEADLVPSSTEPGASVVVVRKPVPKQVRLNHGE